MIVYKSLTFRRRLASSTESTDAIGVPAEANLRGFADIMIGSSIGRDVATAFRMIIKSMQLPYSSTRVTLASANGGSPASG